MATNAYIEDVYPTKKFSLKTRVTKGIIVPGMRIKLSGKEIKIRGIKIQNQKFEKAVEGELVDLDVGGSDYKLFTDAARSEVELLDPIIEELKGQGEEKEENEEDPAKDYNEITVDEMKEVYHHKDKHPKKP